MGTGKGVKKNKSKVLYISQKKIFASNGSLLPTFLLVKAALPYMRK